MQNQNYQKHTQYIFIASKLLNSPLGVMYGLLSFILLKNFGATPFQITLLISSKPIVAIGSFYTFLFIKNRPERLKILIILSTLLSFLPALFFPFFENSWLAIASFALFMMGARAILPAWTEIFKLNLDPEEQGVVFSRGATVNYLTNIALPLVIAPIMDYYPSSWKWIFVLFGSLQFFHLYLLSQLKIRLPNQKISHESPAINHSLTGLLLEPWRNSWTLMRERADFRSYQIVFFLSGSGLILVQPILPIFFEETLQLSYTQIALAISLCKGVGFALTSPIWGQWFNRLSINLFNFYVTAFAALFGIILVMMGQHLEWIYLAYLIYGIMQAGSELSWHLAGPKFSEKEESTLYTSVNVAMVGLRGCIAPFLGELLFFFSSTSTVFLFSALLCSAASLYSSWLVLQERKKKTSYDFFEA